MRLPTGIQDFRRLRDQGRYYIDKTELIDRILSDEADVYLFVRPRRFGKSLNLSMLDCYFNMRDKEPNRVRGRFDGLRITELRPDDPEMNTHPVIAIDMKDTDYTDYGLFLDSIRDKMVELSAGFPELRDSDRIPEGMRRMYSEVCGMEANENRLKTYPGYLAKMLHLHFGREAVVLIDEYDYAADHARDPEIRTRILDFMRTFVSSVFKGNGSVFLGVATGIMQVAKESMFSGFNSARIDNVLDTGFDDIYGFTDEEVVRLCTDRGCRDKIGEIRDYYSGYRFGDTRIYNPWSLLNYLGRGCRPDTYWGETSDNDIIRRLLSGDVPYRDLLTLMSGEPLVMQLDTDVSFDDLESDPDCIFSILVMGGYLSAAPAGNGMHLLSIPNREMSAVFRKKIMGRIGVRYASVASELCRAFVSGDPAEAESLLGEVFDGSVSVRMLGREQVYQGILLGMMLDMSGDYDITADMEHGDGYPDILMRNRRGDGPNIVIEVKRLPAGASDSEAARMSGVAMGQISGKGYARGLGGAVLTYAVVFRGKEPHVEMRETVSQTLS